jgi:hypothetical protein
MRRRAHLTFSRRVIKGKRVETLGICLAEAKTEPRPNTMQIIVRHLWFVLIAAHLVGLTAIMWKSLAGTDGPHQAVSERMSNPFVLAEFGGPALAWRVAAITIEIRFAQGVESCATVFIFSRDRINPADEKV